MSRKDYIKFAAMIKEYVLQGQTAIPITCLIDDMCTLFRRDNPSFSEGRFISAIGYSYPD